MSTDQEVVPHKAVSRPAAAVADDADAYSIAEFCKRHRISLQLYYKLRQQGLTPAEFRVGARVLISRESAERWRREREAATAAANARPRNKSPGQRPGLSVSESPANVPPPAGERSQEGRNVGRDSA